MLRRLEACLKHLSGITPGIYAHNPVQLLAPDADDILIGGWHWTSVGSLRTFPVAEYWYNHYEMNSWERLRSLTVHQRACQKLMYNRGSPRHQLLLRSHLCPCIENLRSLYPQVCEYRARPRGRSGIICGLIDQCDSIIHEC
jgi:hypothetical protein